MKSLPSLSPEEKKRLSDHSRLFASPPQELPAVPQLSAEQWRELEAILSAPGWREQQAQPPAGEVLVPLIRRLRGSLSDAIARRDTGALLRVLRAGGALSRQHARNAVEVMDLQMAASWIQTELLAAALLFMEPGEPVLKEIASLLADDPFTADIAKEALRYEHTQLRQLIETKVGTDSSGENWSNRWRYKPRATLNLFAAYAEFQISTVITAPAAEVAAHPFSRLDESFAGKWQSNAVGKQMLLTAATGYDNLVLRPQLAYRRALRVAVALGRFHLREGRLPAALTDLVPDFLPAVPLDPYDFAPLRWDPKEKLIYATGPDGAGTKPQLSRDESGTPGYYILTLGIKTPGLRYRRKADGPDYTPAKK